MISDGNSLSLKLKSSFSTLVAKAQTYYTAKMRKAPRTCNDPSVRLSTNAEVKEHFLQKTTLSIIAQNVSEYMNSQDLRRMGRVCKTWQHIVSYAENARKLQILRMPVQFVDSLIQEIRLYPYASLLMYDSALENRFFAPDHAPRELWYEQRYQGLHRILMDEYRRQLPNNIFLIKTDVILSDLDPVNGRDVLSLLLPRLDQEVPLELLGIFSLDSTIVGNAITRAHGLDEIAIKLGVRRTDSYDATIIIFSVYKSEMLTSSIESIFQRCETDANVTVTRLFVSRIFGRYEGEDKDLSTVVIKIGDSRIKSWNVSIDYRAQRNEIKQKLQELHSQVSYNGHRHYLGFFNSLNCTYVGCVHNQHPCGDSGYMMHNLKLLFPYVTFINIFKNVTHNEYTATSKLNESRIASNAYFRAYRNRTRILIISY